MAEAKPVVPTVPTDQEKSAFYTKASTTLRDNHREEFADLLRALYQEAGYTYRPRLTAKERAAEKVKALLEEFPDLLDAATPQDEPEPVETA